MFHKILIANRGEIAVRIIRACRNMGIRSVAVYSKEDKDSLHVQLADQRICIGEGPARNNYLNMQQIVTAALNIGADAIHPGFGFLSENSDFVRLCEEHGIAFIGPSADVIDSMGNKSHARKTMMEAGVPVIPGSKEPVFTVEEGLKTAREVGFPVMIKASSGGGGKGMRVSYGEDDFAANFQNAQMESVKGFSDDTMYIERFVERPRHIEFQILADSFGNVVHLGERDCSIQRRNQKLIEEAPARCLTPELREEMGRAAVKAAQAVHYEGAGTVEFLLDSDGQHFYFMEMNTRIQVEHGITEMITGVDLVRQQLRIASGLPLDLTQEDVTLTGHAIECRINAEDPARNFQPCPGHVEFLHFPGGTGVRVDSCLYNGCQLSPYYDSMAAKILAHAPSRMETIRKMRRCLEEFALEGFPTNAELSYQILYHPDFILGKCTTAFLDTHLSDLLEFNRQLNESEAEE